MDSIQLIIPTKFNLPRRIARLGELAYNLWWTWNPDAQRLFARIDLNLWEHVSHNPVLFLRQINRSQLDDETQGSLLPGLLRPYAARVR